VEEVAHRAERRAESLALKIQVSRAKSSVERKRGEKRVTRKETQHENFILCWWRPSHQRRLICRMLVRLERNAGKDDLSASNEICRKEKKRKNI